MSVKSKRIFQVRGAVLGAVLVIHVDSMLQTYENTHRVDVIVKVYQLLLN